MALGRLGKCCRSLVSESSKSLFCSVSRSRWIDGCVGAKRYLLSEDVIRLQEFQQRKQTAVHHVTGSKGDFIEQFHQKLQMSELILQSDLKCLLHLCQSSDDMLIAKDAIYRYHAENRNLAPGDFRFGPLFVRLCYELGMEDMAVTALMDDSMKGFFNDTTSFNITLDMLFLKGSYGTGLELLSVMRKRSLPFSKDTVTLAVANCYKLNTPESYKICTALMEDIQTKGFFMPRHAYCFAIGLALRQNDLEKAKTLYSQIMNTDSRLCQNFKVVLLAMSGGIAEALSVLSRATLPKSPHFVKKPEFSQEVVDLLRLRSKDSQDMSDVEKVITQLEEAGQVTQKTLDEMLCHTPTGRRKPSPMKEERRTSRRTLKPLQSTLVYE